jgi:hypothetical protein
LRAAGASLQSRRLQRPIHSNPSRELLKMNKLLSILFAGVFAVASTAAFAADEKKAEMKKEEAKPAAAAPAKKEEAKPAAAKPEAKKEAKKEETKKKEKKGGC